VRRSSKSPWSRCRSLDVFAFLDPADETPAVSSAELAVLIAELVVAAIETAE